MSDNPVLSEITPTSGVTTLLYTVGLSKTVSGTIFCMNQNNTDDFVGVGLVPAGNTVTSSSWIAFNTRIYHGQSLYLQQIYLNSGDAIWVKSQNGTSNFILNGLENPTTI